jgi:hypothetical protein
MESLMDRHIVTADELDAWLAKEVSAWRQFARSVGRDSDKKLEVSRNGIFRVLDHGKVMYIGVTKSIAIDEYNRAQ